MFLLSYNLLLQNLLKLLTVILSKIKIKTLNFIKKKTELLKKSLVPL